ncbi:hypothetical protein CDAR_236671 [Caerostris darwini]|uniref:Uncharacterized protein n=1 Tax=Caerostris darwini TaxID=1538125 RepID=A0AAV4NH17_9ARAC|nr:hypothetical protein CDAR_236671 [Caerostris darwini]
MKKAVGITEDIVMVIEQDDLVVKMCGEQGYGNASTMPGERKRANHPGTQKGKRAHYLLYGLLIPPVWLKVGICAGTRVAVTCTHTCPPPHLLSSTDTHLPSDCDFTRLRQPPGQMLLCKLTDFNGGTNIRVHGSLSPHSKVDLYLSLVE